MRQAPTEFTRKGFNYRQIERCGMVAIYQQTRLGRESPINYEVVILRETPTKYILGKEIPAHERYPVSEDWGSHAWSTRYLERAKELLALHVARLAAPSKAISHDQHPTHTTTALERDRPL